MKIYTKKGDTGKTSLVGGRRVSKSDARIEAYGTIDELNAQLGYLVSLLPPGHEVDVLEGIQHRLFNVGCSLATPPAHSGHPMTPQLSDEDVTTLEQEIDRMQAALPPQTHFILPGGCEAGAWAHVCRTVCRRAERRMVFLAEESEVETTALRLINRLSDYLFVLSRHLNSACGKAEKKWQSTCK